MKTLGMRMVDLPAGEQIPVMAYAPFDHRGTVLRHPAVIAVAERHGVTPGQVALAWAHTVHDRHGRG